MEPYIWAMFYQSVVAMQFHPGSKGEVDLRKAAVLADKMYAEFCLRKEVLWRGLSEDSPP